MKKFVFGILDFFFENVNHGVLRDALVDVQELKSFPLETLDRALKVGLYTCET